MSVGQNVAFEPRAIPAVVFTDPDGFLTEGSFTSLFVRKDGVLMTPPLAELAALHLLWGLLTAGALRLLPEHIPDLRGGTDRLVGTTLLHRLVNRISSRQPAHMQVLGELLRGGEDDVVLIEAGRVARLADPEFGRDRRLLVERGDRSPASRDGHIAARDDHPRALDPALVDPALVPGGTPVGHPADQVARPVGDQPGTGQDEREDHEPLQQGSTLARRAPALPGEAVELGARVRRRLVRYRSQVTYAG